MKTKANFGQEVAALLYKEALTEWRQRYALNGLLLYAFIVVFTLALAFRNALPVQVWNAAFWIIHLFVGVNAVAKSFLGENEGQTLYLYQLAGAVSIITAKMLYNAALLVFMALATGVFYIFLLGNPVQAPLYFLLALFLGSLAMAATLTLASAIVAGANNKATLMAVLGLPLLVPQLLTAIRISQGAVDGFLRGSDCLILGAMAVLAAALSVMLFPFLWRE